MGEHNEAFGERQLERINWYDGRLLTTDDLDAEQSYFRERMRRRNRLLHGWGVVRGLEVTAASGLQLQMTAGFALDEAGNEIVAPSDVTFDAQTSGLRAAGRMHWVAIRWDECPSGTAPASDPDQQPMTASWIEDHELAVLEEQPAEGGPVTNASAAPWLALATVVWDGRDRLTVDATVRRPLQPPLDS